MEYCSHWAPPDKVWNKKHGDMPYVICCQCAEGRGRALCWCINWIISRRVNIQLVPCRREWCTGDPGKRENLVLLCVDISFTCWPLLWAPFWVLCPVFFGMQGRHFDFVWLPSRVWRCKYFSNTDTSLNYKSNTPYVLKKWQKCTVKNKPPYSCLCPQQSHPTAQKLWTIDLKKYIWPDVSSSWYFFGPKIMLHTPFWIFLSFRLMISFSYL